MSYLVSTINEELVNSPYRLYETDKLKLIRIKTQDSHEKKEKTLRNGINGTGQIYTNEQALKKILQIIQNHQ